MVLKQKEGKQGEKRSRICKIYRKIIKKIKKMAGISSYPIKKPSTGTKFLGTEGDPQTNLYKLSDIEPIILGYTSYVAKFTQTGTDNPVAIELKNNTGKTFTWTRTAPGFYLLLPNTDFLEINNVWVSLATCKGGGNGITIVSDLQPAYLQIENTVVTSGFAQDGITQGNVEIRIYS
jgi:hypothetical protein